MERTLGSRECFLLRRRRAEQSSRQSKKQSLPSVDPRGSPEYHKPELSLWLSTAASLQPAPQGLRPGASLPVHQFECHVLEWKQGCLWVPSLISMIHRSPRDQHRDLSFSLAMRRPVRNNLIQLKPKADTQSPGPCWLQLPSISP